MTDKSNRPPHTALNDPRLLAPLESARKRFAETTLKTLFESDPDRFRRYLVKCGDLTLDFSKNHIDSDTLTALCDLATAANIKREINALFSGALVNNTEQRAALHSALRAPLNKRPTKIAELIESTLHRMYEFSHKINSGAWKGFSGKPIETVVNIGIGGSDLGPAMTFNALSSYQVNKGLKFYFVSNIDPTDVSTTLEKCDPETTLFIIASKTFTTLETLSNANAAREWFLKKAEPTDVAKHFVAISTNAQRVSDFGIDTSNMLPMWDWVGGRYSIWSAIGLPLCIAIGENGFQSFLAGAHSVDEHFYNEPLETNAPIIMGLLSIWYSEFFGTQSHGILCYEDYLEKFPDYLQQLDMESNGKQVTKTGEKVNYKTGIPIWGNVGSNSQHSFHQLLHQGTVIVPVDFIVGLSSCNPCGEQQGHLFANCLAQSQALMNGRNESEIEQELRNTGLSEAEVQNLKPHKVILGNKPSTTIVYPKLSPSIVGQLIALYEHKVYAQSVIWGINPFDQWGVELGKKLSGEVFNALSSNSDQQIPSFDSSTAGLVNLYRAAN